jgi:hypothetical protein
MRFAGVTITPDFPNKLHLPPNSATALENGVLALKKGWTLRAVVGKLSKLTTAMRWSHEQQVKWEIQA